MGVDIIWPPQRCKLLSYKNIWQLFTSLRFFSDRKIEGCLDINEVVKHDNQDFRLFQIKLLLIKTVKNERWTLNFNFNNGDDNDLAESEFVLVRVQINEMTWIWICLYFDQ